MLCVNQGANSPPGTLTEPRSLSFTSLRLGTVEPRLIDLNTYVFHSHLLLVPASLRPDVSVIRCVGGQLLKQSLHFTASVHLSSLLEVLPTYPISSSLRDVPRLPDYNSSCLRGYPTEPANCFHHAQCRPTVTIAASTCHNRVIN